MQRCSYPPFVHKRATPWKYLAQLFPWAGYCSVISEARLMLVP